MGKTKTEFLHLNRKMMPASFLLYNLTISSLVYLTDGLGSRDVGIGRRILRHKIK